MGLATRSPISDNRKQAIPQIGNSQTEKIVINVAKISWALKSKHIMPELLALNGFECGASNQNVRESLKIMMIGWFWL